jgi:hypothetical protein
MTILADQAARIDALHVQLGREEAALHAVRDVPPIPTELPYIQLDDEASFVLAAEQEERRARREGTRTLLIRCDSPASASYLEALQSYDVLLGHADAPRLLLRTNADDELVAHARAELGAASAVLPEDDALSFIRSTPRKN